MPIVRMLNTIGVAVPLKMHLMTSSFLSLESVSGELLVGSHRRGDELGAVLCHSLRCRGSIVAIVPMTGAVPAAILIAIVVSIVVWPRHWSRPERAPARPLGKAQPRN